MQRSGKGTFCNNEPYVHANKLQMMVRIDKECGFRSNFGHAEVVYPLQIGFTAQNGEQPIRLPNSLLYPRVEVEQRTHSGDEIASSNSDNCHNQSDAFNGLAVGQTDKHYCFR